MLSFYPKIDLEMGESVLTTHGFIIKVYFNPT